MPQSAIASFLTPKKNESGDSDDQEASSGNPNAEGAENDDGE